RIDFGVRASGFFIAGPAGSGVPSAIPFIVRTTETVIGGVTIPIGVYIADAFIQNASITNAKIGGDIWSSNWAPGVAGWYLQRGGDFFGNSVRLRGNIAGGAYSGYAWPPNNGTGYYLGPEGLLLGNPSTGRYIQIASDGTLYAPGLSIENGRASFSGNVNTGMGAGFRIEMGPDDPVYAMWAGSGAKTDTNAIFYLKRSGAGYFGGALSAGILRTSVTNPTLDANSQVTDGPFGTNGGPITVVCSYWYSEEAGRDGGTYSASGPENSATIQLYRTIRDTAEELVQTFSVTGSTYIQNNGVFDELSFYQRVIEGSITYTDTVGGSQDRTFRAVLVTRSLRTITFNPMPGGIGQSMSNMRQSLSLISTE
ncbi:phage tail tip fiber protein, partial [Duganella phyllosphaerae]|uniref:phage tail tip fiber protein n=1 Tax=Duganella phyllosphaerae TaxID=762836 RepID=UPI000B1BDAE1